jgi:translational activator of cytochrome c oxidase 1
MLVFRVEQLLEEALAEAEDFDQAAERDAHGAQDIELTCPPQALAALTTLVRNSAVTSEVLASELVWAPVERGEADDELRDKVGALVADLEENEDCLRVFTTLD